MKDSQTTVAELKKSLRTFISVRKWQQFHTPKDLAIAISVEAAEILEHFRFRNGNDLKKHIKAHHTELGFEIADVFSFLVRLADETGIDVAAAVADKMAINEKRYPIRRSSGKKWMEIKK